MLLQYGRMRESGTFVRRAVLLLAQVFGLLISACDADAMLDGCSYYAAKTSSNGNKLPCVRVHSMEWRGTGLRRSKLSQCDLRCKDVVY